MKPKHDRRMTDASFAGFFRKHKSNIGYGLVTAFSITVVITCGALMVYNGIPPFYKV